MNSMKKICLLCKIQRFNCGIKRVNIIRAISTGSTSQSTDLIPNDASKKEMQNIPMITSRVLAHEPKFGEKRHAWVVNLDTVEERKLGMINMHPTVWGAFPRIDLLHENMKWQSLYGRVNWTRSPTRAELPGGGHKPWPQKGLGKARHGSTRSPLWVGGGIAHGPRGPKSYFYMIPFFNRIHGLISALSCKMAQDDLHIVDSLEIPTEDTDYLLNLADERCWNTSVLFVDESDFMPRNIAIATDKIPHFNLMPVYGLNVWSILKHETLILTLAAVERIEERIMFNLKRLDSNEVQKAFRYEQRPRPPNI